MDDDSSSGDAMDVGPDEEAAEGAGAGRVWDPSVYALGEDEELDYDATAYKCMHELGVEWPCLSFDVVPDSLGFMRKTWPQTLYLVAGSQASDPAANRIMVMKIANLTEMPRTNDEDDDDDEEDEAYIPVVRACHIKQRAGVNRVKCMPQNGTLVASWSEGDGGVAVHNVAALLRSLDDDKEGAETRVVDWKPVAGFAGHAREGFALAWSGVAEGALLSGDGAGAVHVWEPETVGARRNWAVDTAAFRGHEGSVEDLAWSPTEARVFASCSSDKTVRLWDARGKKQPVVTLQAHQDEVNVIGWNPHLTHLLASGADDGVWKVHDLRKASSAGSPDVFVFGFHKHPISSIEWCPFEDSMIAVASSDDSVTVWDLSATKDDDAPPEPVDDDPFLATVPEQLLFVHRGLTDPKEVHWHKQVPGLIGVTAANGFHLFAPENCVN